jgi:hypothetical protein
MFDLGFQFCNALGQDAAVFIAQRETHTAGPDETLAEAVAADPQTHVQKIAAHATAIIGRR